MPYKDTVKAKEYGKAYRSLHKEKMRNYAKAYQTTNKELLAAKKHIYYKSKRLDKYGITQEEFDHALVKQNYACAICSRAFTEKVRVYVDHCHTTGKVRGLVCFHCNTGLGHFQDNPELLQKAVTYLYDNPFNYTRYTD